MPFGMQIVTVPDEPAAPSSEDEVEAASSSETSIHIYKTTRRHILGDHNFLSRRHQNLKSDNHALTLTPLLFLTVGTVNSKE
jgi:hypothetical protein